jgi:hypothetical protein
VCADCSPSGVTVRYQTETTCADEPIVTSRFRICIVMTICVLVADCHGENGAVLPKAVGGHPTTVVWAKGGATRADYEIASQQCRQTDGINGKCMFDRGWTRIVSYFCDQGSKVRTTCSGPNGTGDCQMTNCE